jgi:hypothetical protein
MALAALGTAPCGLHPTASFAAKRAELLGRPISDLLVVTDFDLTLTCGTSLQCHDVLGTAACMPAGARAEFAELLDFSRPFPAHLQREAWWHRANDILLAHGAPLRHHLPLLVGEAGMAPRPGALELLAKLAQLDVPVGATEGEEWGAECRRIGLPAPGPCLAALPPPPPCFVCSPPSSIPSPPPHQVLIVSAGCADLIEHFLEAHGALSPNVRVSSNRLMWDPTSGALVRCTRPPSPSPPPHPPPGRVSSDRLLTDASPGALVRSYAARVHMTHPVPAHHGLSPSRPSDPPRWYLGRSLGRSVAMLPMAFLSDGLVPRSLPASLPRVESEPPSRAESGGKPCAKSGGDSYGYSGDQLPCYSTPRSPSPTTPRP